MEDLEGMPDSGVGRLFHALACSPHGLAELHVPVPQDVQLRDADERRRKPQVLQLGGALGHGVAPGVVTIGARRQRQPPVAVRGGQAERRSGGLHQVLLRRGPSDAAEERLDQDHSPEAGGLEQG